MVRFENHWIREILFLRIIEISTISRPRIFEFLLLIRKWKIIVFLFVMESESNIEKRNSYKYESVLYKSLFFLSFF